VIRGGSGAPLSEDPNLISHWSSSGV